MLEDERRQKVLDEGVQSGALIEHTEYTPRK